MTPHETRGNLTSVRAPNEHRGPAIEAFLETITDGFIALDAGWIITYVNGETERLCAMRREDMVGRDHWDLFPASRGTIVERELCRAAKERTAVEFDNYYASWQRWFHVKAAPASGGGLSVFFEDVTERKRSEHERSALLERERSAREEAETLNDISRALAAERDLQKLVQLITDAATKLTGAKFGSFFYNLTNINGESYLLYTLSGVPREAFSKFPLPRNTAVFEPTFRGSGVVRSDDITKDPRYGKMAPHHGMPKGHLPVCSYLAAPVMSRDGEVLGGLFFGHPEPGKFSDRVERLIVGIAAHAAVAIENAHEFEKRRRTEELLRQSEQRFREIIDALPAAIYTTDAEGKLTHFNQAAINLSGRLPRLGSDAWCVTWKLYNSDGSPLPHDQCPMATALKERRAIRGAEAIAERPDGSRFWFAPYPTPLYDTEGKLTGGINMLVDITERKTAEEAMRLFGAIVDSSDDAIISKNLNGVITSWNKSADRLFGYTADEAIGQTVASLLIPADRQDEEPEILARLQRGERVDHFETVRRHKDGSLPEISLTISPVRDSRGTVVGASKIARDITDRKRTERVLQSLTDQMKHDLAAMTRLQELSTRLVEAQDVTNLLREIVAVALEITGAEKGNIQLLEKGVLRIVAHEGFEQPFLDFFNEVHDGQAACGAALAKGNRIVIENVAASDVYDSTARKAMLDAEVLAVQSTPLITRSGEVLGMFSTHYSRAGMIAEHDLRCIDLLARQAADLIERRRADTALRTSEERFRVAQRAAKIGIFEWNIPTGVNTWSTELEELHGLRPGSFAGTKEAWESLIHPEDLDNALGKVD
ncbi:MAG TPA: PAS domain S-box protein, partial [Bryobacteraceae bacterium]